MAKLPPTKEPPKKAPAIPGADRFSAFKIADIYAVKGLVAGTANEDQQKRAFMWIVEHACRTFHTSHVRGDPYETAFNEGRRFAGMEILKMVKTDIKQLNEE